MSHDIFSDDLPLLFILIPPKDIIVKKYDYFVPQSETYIGGTQEIGLECKQPNCICALPSCADKEPCERGLILSK
jgi:hypothetical protein